LLGRVDTGVTADQRYASRAWTRAAETLLDHHAVASAAVIASAVPIIAGLGRLSLAVSAVVRRIDATASSTTSATRLAADASSAPHTSSPAIAPSASDSLVSARGAVTTSRQTREKAQGKQESPTILHFYSIHAQTGLRQALKDAFFGGSFRSLLRRIHSAPAIQRIAPRGPSKVSVKTSS
jgi:hypothetical protein